MVQQLRSRLACIFGKVVGGTMKATGGGFPSVRRKSGAVVKATGDGNVHLRSTDVFIAPTDLRNLWVCGLAFQLVWLAS